MSLSVRLYSHHQRPLHYFFQDNDVIDTKWHPVIETGEIDKEILDMQYENCLKESTDSILGIDLMEKLCKHMVQALGKQMFERFESNRDMINSVIDSVFE